MINKKRLYNWYKLTLHFISLIRGLGIIAAIKIDIIQFFKTVRYKHNYILSYLGKHYSDVINEHINAEQIIEQIPEDCFIWVCWFQGVTQMPESVGYCFESIKKNSGNAKVQLITLDNYLQFVTLPEYIIDKVDRGNISLTHFSDILRCNLLADYGGIWIDASLLLTGKLQIPSLPFFSIKLRRPKNDYSFVSDYRWVAGFMGGAKGNVLHSFMKDVFNAYWKTETILIDYFLVDYVIALAYKNIPVVKKMIDDVPFSNEDFYYLEANLFNPVNKMELEQVLKRSWIFKIGYKGFPLKKSDNSLYKYLFH